MSVKCRPPLAGAALDRWPQSAVCELCCAASKQEDPGGPSGVSSAVLEETADRTQVRVDLHVASVHARVNSKVSETLDDISTVRMANTFSTRLPVCSAKGLQFTWSVRHGRAQKVQGMRTFACQSSRSGFLD